MESILKKEQKAETGTVIEFIKGINIKEEEAFKLFIEGFKFAKQIERIH